MLLLRLQVGLRSDEDGDEIDDSSVVSRPGKSQRLAGMLDLILQPRAALLLRR